MADIGGVEFLIELNAKLDQALKMTKALTQTEAAVLKADAAMRKAEKSVGLLNRAFQHLKNKAGEILKDFLGHFTALAAWDFTKGMVRRGYEMGKGLLHAAAGAEKTSRAFKFLFGADAEMMEEKADQLAKITKHSDDQMKETMQELGAAGLKPVEIIDAIMVAADAAAKTGKDSAFDSTIMALKMMKTMNKMPPGRVFQNLALAPEAAKEMQKQIKRGTGALQAFMNVVDKTSGKPIFTAAVEAGKDLGVTLQKLEDLQGQYGQKLAKTAGYDKLKDAFGGLLKAFDPDSENGKKIFTALEQMLGKVAEVLKGIDVNAMAGAFVRLIGVLPGIVQYAGELVTVLVSLFNAAMRVVDLYDKVNGKGDGKEKASPESVHRASQPTLFEKVLMEVPGGAAYAGTRMYFRAKRELDRLAEQTGKGAAEGQAKGMVAALPSTVTKASEKLVGATVDPAKEGLELHSPSRVFERIGRNTAAGFALGIDGAVPQLERSVAQAFSPGALVGGAGFGAGAAAAVAGRSEGGGPRLSADITVNIGGVSGGDDVAREVAQASGTAIRQALAAWMEEMAAEGMAG